MSALSEALINAEARVEQIKLQIAQGTCAQTGHNWKHIGGMNASCGDGCSCSVPVYSCDKCGDSDYGQNAEAEEKRRSCMVESQDCTCQRWPTHCANDCPLHGIDGDEGE